MPRAAATDAINRLRAAVILSNDATWVHHLAAEALAVGADRSVVEAIVKGSAAGEDRK